jgi:hypothetical protein
LIVLSFYSEVAKLRLEFMELQPNLTIDLASSTSKSGDLVRLRRDLLQRREPIDIRLDFAKQKLQKRENWGIVRTKLVAVFDSLTGGSQQQLEKFYASQVGIYDVAISALDQNNVEPAVVVIANSAASNIEVALSCMDQGSVGFNQVARGVLFDVYRDMARRDLDLIRGVSPHTAMNLEQFGRAAFQHK